MLHVSPSVSDQLFGDEMTSSLSLVILFFFKIMISCLVTIFDQCLLVSPSVYDYDQLFSDS